VTGQDKAVVTFTAPESATAQQYEVSLTVSDGEQQHHLLLNVKAKAATPSRTKALPALTQRGARTASTKVIS
jgi:hypothetical protein